MRRFRRRRRHEAGRGRIRKEDLLGFNMSDIVEFTLPKTGQPAIGKIIDFKKPEFSPYAPIMQAEISVKAVQDENGQWYRYQDFYDFQLVPVDKLQRSSWSIAKERMVPRAAHFASRKAMRKQRRAMKMPGWKLLRRIDDDPATFKHFFDMLVELAEDVDLEVSEDLSPYEYSEAVGLLGDEMQKYFGDRSVDWYEVAEAFVTKHKDAVYKILYTTLGGAVKRQRKATERRKAMIRRHSRRPLRRNRFASRRRVPRRRRSLRTRLSSLHRRRHRLAAEPPIEIVYERLGPGKFSDTVEEQVYEWSLEGWASEQLGDAADFGYHELIEIPEGVIVHDPSGEDWTFQSVIMVIESQGFVYATYFDTIEEGRKVWREVEEDYEEFIQDVLDANPGMTEEEFFSSY